MKAIIFCRDFHRILPVVPGGSRAKILNAWIGSSTLFTSVNNLSLSENFITFEIHHYKTAINSSRYYP